MRIGVSAFIGVGLLALLFWREHDISGSGHFLYPELMVHMIWLLPGVLFVRRWRSVTPRSGPIGGLRRRAPELVLLGIMLLYMFSGAVTHRWYYFLHWVPHPGIQPLYFGSSLILLILTTAVTWPLLAGRKTRCAWLLLAILIAAQVFCCWKLIDTTGGEALYRDDHASFMFRFFEFARTFPRVNVYNPYWNGGVAETFGTGSGIQGLGILFWPLWRFAPVHEVYTFAIGFVYILLIPWVATLSLRIMKMSHAAALCGGILALGVSQYFFLWLLNYGTVCANFSSALILPIAACLYRIMWLDKREKWLFALLIISGYFLLRWAPGAIMAVTLMLCVAVSSHKLTKRKLLYLLLCAAGIGAMHAHAVWTLFVHAKADLDYVVRPATSGGGSLWATQALSGMLHGFKHLLSHLLEWHPMLIFLGIGGLLSLHDRRIRRWCWPAILCLGVIAGWGRELFPRLQLSRMAIPMAFIAIIPAATTAGRLLDLRQPGASLARALVIGMCVLTGWNVGQIYGNRGLISVSTMPDRMKTLVAFVQEEVPQDGRVMFAGRTVHAYGRGHVAYLPVLCGRQMMACDYYAFPTDMVEYAYPPRPFRDSPSGMARFVELYNVTHVITYHETWQSALAANTNTFSLITEASEQLSAGTDRPYTVYGVDRPSSICLKGSATVKGYFSVIRIAVKSLEDGELVIKYNWSERLNVEAPAEIFPYDAGDDITLIGIRPNGLSQLRIHYGRKR